MKKTIALLLILILAAGLAFAATSTRYQKYLNIFKKGEYTIKGRTYELDDNGKMASVSYPVVIAAKGGNFYIESAEDGMSLRFIVKDGVMNMIDDENKSIMAMEAEEEDQYNILPLESPEITSSGNGKLDNKNLYYEKYRDEYYDEYTLWFDGNNLYALQSPTSVVIFDSFTEKADDSLFVLPAGYEVVDLMTMFANMFAFADDTAAPAATETSSDDEFDWTALLEGIDWGSLFSSDDSDWDDSDWSWDDSDWDVSDWQYDAQYEALGVLFGLTEEQASDFMMSMAAIETAYWYSMNQHYNTETGRYDLTLNDLDDFLTENEIEAIRKLTGAFKK